MRYKEFGFPLCRITDMLNPYMVICKAVATHVTFFWISHMAGNLIYFCVDILNNSITKFNTGISILMEMVRKNFL